MFVDASRDHPDDDGQVTNARYKASIERLSADRLGLYPHPSEQPFHFWPCPDLRGRLFPRFPLTLPLLGRMESGL